MAMGREAGHISAYFGQDHLGRATTDAGDSFQPEDRFFKRVQTLPDLLTQAADRFIEIGYVSQVLAQEEARCSVIGAARGDKTLRIITDRLSTCKSAGLCT